METRQLLRYVKGTGDYASRKRSARVWRITKGVLRSETGKVRVTLYYSGKRMGLPLNTKPLCDDMAQADEVVRLWLQYGLPYTSRSQALVAVWER